MSTLLLELFFNPPIAVARVGSSDTPLEAFVWSDNPSLYGVGHTAIEPTVSLEIDRNHVVRPYVPSIVHFKDNNGIRPTAPFFELWGVFEEDGETVERPLDLAALRNLDATVGDVAYAVTAANLKAARRTGDPTCGYWASVECNATNYGPHPLLASSAGGPGQEPLVSPERPIPFGALHVLRPVDAHEMAVNLGTLRVRFIPGAGHVYGPPHAIASIGPGGNRIHTIVPPEHRILNPRSAWCSYDSTYARFDNPEPSDTYDGADMPNHGNRSWGVVDDTCDAIVTATIVVGGTRFSTSARVFVGPPDFAPDRRPFASIADDFADRVNPAPAPITDETLGEIADLLRRVFETVSLLNLDYTRNRAIRENQFGDFPPSQPPHTDERTMTADDVGFAIKTPPLVAGVTRDDRKPYAEAARAIHEPLADPDLLATFLCENADRIRTLLRPPFGLLSDFKRPPPGLSPRDPRNARDRAHDMRMPPYMRDELAAALSLNRRQYLQILDYIDYLEGKPRPAANAVDAAAPAPAAEIAGLSPAERHLRQVVDRRRDAER